MLETVRELRLRRFCGQSLLIAFMFLAFSIHAEKPKQVTLQQLSEHYDAFLLDAFGVFWESNQTGAVPGAKEAMEYLVSQGKVVGILSNSTQLAAKEKEKYGRHGILEKTHYHFILTSGEVAYQLLATEVLPFPVERKTYWLFGLPHPRVSHRHLFDETGYRETDSIDEADFIYIPTPHIGGEDQTDPAVFEPAVALIPSHLPVFCANPDAFAIEGSPPQIVVRQGTIARLFAERGFSVYSTGKPSEAIFNAALARFPAQIDKEKIVMIGDTPETDVRGAHRVGLKAALVTKTGVMAKRIERDGAESILGELPASDRPEFLLERLISGVPNTN